MEKAGLKTNSGRLKQANKTLGVWAFHRRCIDFWADFIIYDFLKNFEMDELIFIFQNS